MTTLVCPVVCETVYVDRTSEKLIGKAGRLQRMFAKSREQQNAKRNREHQVRIAVLCETLPQRSKPVTVCHKLHTHSNNNFNTIHAKQKIQRQCRELI
ncbi:hypothetical protein ACWA5Z_12230 [Testudinibacter sp. P80/BLE/0925]|uniref:hypothetical protein n=1 Tax=Testudinibacter sp. TW-1 TaxID=3417757 RepID=UPI003D3610FB